MVANAEDRAYLAGILDGEGSFVAYHGSRHSSNSYRFCIEVANSDKKLIDWIVCRFGGSVYTFHPQHDGHKAEYRVEWHRRDDIVDIIGQVEDYLVIKTEVAQMLLEFLSFPSNFKEDRRMLSEVICGLNKKGTK